MVAPTSMMMRLARTKSGHKAHKHAAIVVRGGAIVAVGVNHDLIHAEVNALAKLWPSEREGTKVFSIRLRRSGTLGMAKPCPECEAYMREAGVKAVVFTNSNGEWETLKL